MRKYIESTIGLFIALAITIIPMLLLFLFIPWSFMALFLLMSVGLAYCVGKEWEDKP